MKPTNQVCPECGFRLDPDNPSESVCPAIVDFNATSIETLV